MREIKFRAWDTLGHHWVDVFDLHQDEQSLKAGEYVQSTGNDVWDVRLNQKDYVLMQYTGLKDKNGVEIYEGDILKREVGHIDHWDEGQPVFTREWKNSAVVYRAPSFKMDASITIDYINEKEVEVIGNIYDNPELLNQE